MENNIWLKFPSSIEKITEYNESFDSCVIRVCYSGNNRNKSSISKQSIEDAIPTIYNCPIVCNYNIYDDTIGGHDVEIVKTSNGMKIVNLTDAIGVIPYGAQHYWECVDDDGVEREYLCVEAILWKRSAAYSKIKRDGIVSQSMEITVKNGAVIDGIYQINSFVFTAFCLLGDDIEPCFESASLHMFEHTQFNLQFAAMMNDLKEEFYAVSSLNKDDINQNLTKGGKVSMERTELLSEYGLTSEDLDFNMEEFSVEELKVKFEEVKRRKVDDEEESAEEENADEEVAGGESEEEESETESEEDEEEETENETEESFSLLAEDVVSQLCDALYSVRVAHPEFGDMPKYYYIDFDIENKEVYCSDSEDWNLYGFKFSMNGDNVVVDFESKKRKKFSIVDFDEGSAEFCLKKMCETFGKAVFESRDGEVAEIQGKFDASQLNVADLQNEVDALKEYKLECEKKERKAECEKLFANFADLNGEEMFEELKNSCEDMDVSDIESKCFEIRGRKGVTANFSAQKNKTIRMPVVTASVTDEPYNGLFIKYPPKN